MGTLLFGIIWVLLWSACSNDAQKEQDHGLGGLSIISPEVNGDLGENLSLDFAKLKLSLLSQINSYQNSYFSVHVSCDNVHGGKNDWSKTASQVKDTIDLVADKHCFIVLNSYNDGRRTFTPVSQALTIEISPDGSIKEGLPMAYTSGPPEDLVVGLWPISPGPFSLVLNPFPRSFPARGHRGRDSPPPGNGLDMAPISLILAHVPAPIIDNLDLYVEEGVNGAAKLYTLIADVSGATGCKYVDNSSNTYSPTEWMSVDSAYHSLTAQNCPSFDPADPGFTPGNWNGLWAPGKKYLIIWVNTVNGLSSYSSADLGSQ